MSKVLVLTAITGPQSSKRYTVSGRQAKLGSASSNDLVLQDRSIEPRHAEIHQMLDRWFIVPLTPNGRGISLNGMPLEGRGRLNAGDRVTIGAITYSVSFTEEMAQEVGALRTSSSGVPRLGDYFVRRGLMSLDQVSHTATRQSELARGGRPVAFGQLAYELGYINRSQLETALADQRSDFNERFRD